MHLDSANISQYLERKAYDHEYRETPCLVAPELACVDGKKQSEEGAEEGVAA